MNRSTHHSTHRPLAPGGLPPDQETSLDQCIDAALQRKPSPEIPEDFAARIAGQAAALPRRRTGSVPIGRTVAWASAVVLASALFALAPHATPSLSSLSFDAEIVLLLELAGLGWLLSRGIGQGVSR